MIMKIHVHCISKKIIFNVKRLELSNDFYSRDYLHCCWFETCQGPWILSCEEVIQLAYRTSVVLLRCILVPEVMLNGVDSG